MYDYDHLTREELIALLGRQRRLENLLHATDVQLALLDSEFNFIWVNRAYAETCRMAPEAMVGKNHFALYPDPENEAIFRQVRDTGEAVFHKDKPFIFPDQIERGVTYWDWSLVAHQDEAGEVTELVFSLRETTQFVRAEQTRRDTEAQYRLLFETMAQGVIHYGADDRVQSANPAAQRFLGLTLERMRGRTWPELFSQAIQEDGTPFPADAHPAQVALRTGQPVSATLMGIPDPDHPTYRWLRVHAIPQFQVGSAQPVSIHVTFEDVTELMGSQAALRRQERQLRLALDAAHMASFEWDILRDEATNTRWGLNSLNVFPERMVDPIRQLTERIHPEDRARFLAAIEAALTQPQGRYQTEFRVRDPSGRQVWLAEYGHVERDAGGRPVRLLGLTQNITARKEAEEALFAANQRLQALMNALPVGVSFSDDPSCQHITGNPTALAQFEVAPTDNLSASAAEAPGRRVGYFHEGRPLADHELPLQRAVAENRAIPPMELEVHLPSGRRWFAMVSAAPIHDQAGHIMSGVAVIVDITARKQAERQLEASLEEKILLVREVHHRVKNNLQVIVSLLSLQAAHVQNPEAQEGFRDMQRRIYSMAILHEALYKRGTMGGVDGAVYLGHLCEQLGPSFGLMQGRVCLRHRLSPVELTLDQAIPCGLIVNELVSNAYKHAFPGDRKGQIQVVLEIAEDGRQRLEVSDDGIGMPPELNWENGASLGLRLVPGLARQLGGELRLHNGAGTRFSITFPAHGMG